MAESATAVEDAARSHGPPPPTLSGAIGSYESSLERGPPHRAGGLPPTASGDIDPAFGRHVSHLRNTMFYVCQGSCLCGTVNNRGKVIYCYGDLVPRHGELFAEGGDQGNPSTSKHLLAAQLGVWIFGIIALLIVLLLIRKSIASLKRHLERVTDRLPVYHDDDLVSSGGGSTAAGSPSKDGTTVGSGGGGGLDAVHGHHEHDHDMYSEDGTLSPDMLDDGSPIHIGVARLGTAKGVPVEKLKQVRLHRKDFKKGGEALRGKNVTENFRVKEKDVKRTMK